MIQIDERSPAWAEPPAIRRGRPRSAAADDAILHAAATLLVEVGYRPLRMEAIAARAGVSKATLYRRYKDKEAAVTAAIFAVIGGPPDDLPVPEGSIREVLTYLLKVGSIVMTSPAWLPTVGAAFAEGVHEGGLAAALRTQVLDPSAELMLRAVAEGLSRGEVRSGVEPETVADLLFGAVLARSLIGRPVDDDWIDRIVSGVLAGIATAVTTPAA